MGATKWEVAVMTYFWESESSLHAQNFNWSDVGKGWAPEDYQEPSWGVDKAKSCGDISELEKNLVLSCSSFHSYYLSDRNPDTGRVLECHSSSPKSHHTSDSKHSSTQRTIKYSKSPLRQGQHSRSPLRRRCHSRFPMRRDRSHSWDSSGSSGGRGRARTDCCSKCHCKCCQDSSQERFQERDLPHSYKMHHYHSSKETSKSYRISRSLENSTMTRKKKSTHHEETKKGRSISVKETKSSKNHKNNRKKKSTHHEEIKKGRSTSVKETKSSKISLDGSLRKRLRKRLLAQLPPSSEDTVFPHQPSAGKKTGTSAPSKIVEDPRSMVVLTRRNQIEQDYLQVVLNFAVVATMLLKTEPCMEQALEVALRTNIRNVGDYYERMLKDFIDNYDLSEIH